MDEPALLLAPVPPANDDNANEVDSGGGGLA